MKIVEKMKKVPGGLMLIPMLIVAIINTFCPEVLNIGSATTGVFKTGTMCTIGMILFTSGTQLKLANLPQALKRGGVFVLFRTIIVFAVCIILNATVGLDGIAGLSTLALVIVFSSCNPGVYAAVCSTYGDAVDMAAMGVINIIAVPQYALIVLAIVCGGGDANVNILKIIVGTITPFVIGFILGNLDDTFTKMFSTATPIILIFMGCCFGSSINIITAIKSGIRGVILGLLFIVISMAIIVPIDMFILKRPGYAGAVFCTVGGVSIGAPAVIAQTLPQFEPYVAEATGQLAFAVIIGAIVSPIIAKKLGEKAKHSVEN